MDAAELLTRVAAELALFAGVGFLLFAVNDLAVDIIYFARRAWRSAGDLLPLSARLRQRIGGAGQGRASSPCSFRHGMKRRSSPRCCGRRSSGSSTHDYRIFVGHYRNDPATAAAIASVADARIETVGSTPTDRRPRPTASTISTPRWSPTRSETRPAAKAIVLHDAEDLVHPLELTLFDRLVDRAGVVQLPVLPLIDPRSRWVSGHYADEFAEAHIKELVVREAVGAAIPLAGVGCAIERVPLARLAARHDGRPFAGASMTEDYELGPSARRARPEDHVRPDSRPRPAAARWSPAAAISRRRLGAAVRQKARWIGGIAFAGWDRLGWRGGLGERWMRMRDRRGPLAALLLVAGYGAALLWAQLWLAEALGAPVEFPARSAALATLLTVNAWLLAWRILMRAGFTASAYGWRRGCCRCRGCGRQRHRHAGRPPRALPSARRRAASAGTRPAHIFPDGARAMSTRSASWLGRVRLGRGSRGEPRALPGRGASRSSGPRRRRQRRRPMSGRSCRPTSGDRAGLRRYMPTAAAAGRTAASRIRRPIAPRRRCRPIYYPVTPVAVAHRPSRRVAAQSLARREPAPAGRESFYRRFRSPPSDRCRAWPRPSMPARRTAPRSRRRPPPAAPIGTPRPAAADHLGAAARPAGDRPRWQPAARWAAARPARA